VRSKAKGSSARSGRGMVASVGASVNMWAAGLACLFVLFALALGADRAAAGTATDRPLLFTFNGADTSAGAFAGANALDIDQANDLVYVVDEERDVIDKFNLAGVAQGFSSTGSSSLSPGVDLNSFSSIAVDNSGANPGRIHVMREYGPLQAFAPGGELLWSIGGLDDVCGLAVDSAGHPWVGDYTNRLAREYATTGGPPSQTGTVSTDPDQICRLALDASGNLYANKYSGGVDKYVGGVKVSTLDANSTNGVAVDQSSASGHVFTLHNGSFNEYDASGNLLGTYGAGTIGFGSGIAYDVGTGRVYVSDRGSHAVEVFGPVVSGTVPNLTIEPTTEVSVNKATFHGIANPQGVPSSYHFEWKIGAASSWGSAESSPSFSLPADTADHPVSYTATTLGGGRSYEVRLVSVNTENNLRAVSSPDTFTTSVASAPPSVSIDGISAITTTSAHVSATIDTREDLTEWNVQLSTDPACESGFQNRPASTIPGGHAGADTVSEDLGNLPASEHYCVRISATNSAGTTTSETKEFETLEVAPTQAFAAFVAPRTDTTARLNAYANPEGAKLTYHFEYSSDGGTTWTALPEEEDTSEARTPVVVSSELTGLQPQTTYSYRVAVENPAGGETSQPLSFTTRSTAEVTLPTRGVELVNSSDKGTQNVTPPHSAMGESPSGVESAISADGEKALWRVLAGAPGGNNSAFALFLAKRTASGWVSRSVQPPASEQVKGGELSYFLDAMTPDLSHFVMAAERPQNDGHPSYSALIRLDDAENQDVLAEREGSSVFGHVDLTEDAKHVLVIANGHGQLVDVGSGSPEVVSIMPDGTESECLLRDGESFTGGPPHGTGGGAIAGVWRPGYHLINTHDASIVYFEASPNGDCSAPQRLYVRNRDTEQTTLIDPGTDKVEPAFMRTTPDGRYGYFATYSQLDAADTNQGRDIYRWDEESGESTCLTCVVADAQVGDSTISDDFSRIYFQSDRQLIAGKGTKGGENIYVLQEGDLSFVAEVEFPGQSLRTMVSANGAVLLFLAKASPSLTSDAVGTPTGCHPVQRSEDESFGPTSRCVELYRYEASQHSIECLSCARNATTTYNVGTPTGTGSGEDFRISADGSTVAFATKEPLVRADVNRNTDIYEWHNGSIRLVTDGVTAFQEGIAAPQVNAVDRDGKNIFFSVVEPGLTGYEQDEFLNFYDARVGGGFPRPAPVVHCSEESCQGPLQAPPLQGAAGSASLSGAGNEKAQPKARCRKGQARRHGRCVKRHRHAHHKRASHGKRGGSK